ncbi:hypothetical protein Tco_0618521 [Tanacetum coccineum]
MVEVFAGIFQIGDLPIYLVFHLLQPLMGHVLKFAQVALVPSSEATATQSSISLFLIILLIPLLLHHEEGKADIDCIVMHQKFVVFLMGSFHDGLKLSVFWLGIDIEFQDVFAKPTAGDSRFFCSLYSFTISLLLLIGSRLIRVMTFLNFCEGGVQPSDLLIKIFLLGLRASFLRDNFGFARLFVAQGSRPSLLVSGLD